MRSSKAIKYTGYICHCSFKTATILQYQPAMSNQGNNNQSEDNSHYHSQQGAPQSWDVHAPQPRYPYQQTQFTQSGWSADGATNTHAQTYPQASQQTSPFQGHPAAAAVAASSYTRQSSMAYDGRQNPGTQQGPGPATTTPDGRQVGWHPHSDQNTAYGQSNTWMPRCEKCLQDGEQCNCSHGYPCSNCTAANVQCRLPAGTSLTFSRTAYQ
ncbi:hypothetical protein BD324DRAFT_43204 [Kockovaella imperatae]|uniref:Uncharacterized protein n=1 Tax=Kockovaella imperatae TaxID=4999 RepID=A0A1Y1UUH9_9TREE|nr:hypothetical protein BD324DRAFT_43204 [Kockovaella imperatae]ORX41126.1 hypothetical protein BD324DRAFT_43204 [Kockovaella imperatae]